MRNIKVFVIGLLLVVSCKNNSENKKADIVDTTISETKLKCTNEINFGNTPICLPELKGLVEAYSHPKVKLRVDKFEDSNTTLGYYIDDETYKDVENFESVSYDNYYKVYASTEAMDTNIGRSEMKQISEIMTTGLIDKTMDNLNESDSFSAREIKITQPVLVEKYALNSNSATIVLFMRISNSEIDQIKAITMTTCIINERLIFIAHYLDYKDEKTLKLLKANTKTFMDAFFEAND